jgi:hypothetical protein
MRSRFGIGMITAVGICAGTLACDRDHIIGTIGGYIPTQHPSDGSVPPHDGPLPSGDGPSVDGAILVDAGSVATSCNAACAAIMGCGLGGYGPYHEGIGYAYAYTIGAYGGYATGYSPTTSVGYGAYGFRDLEYQQCVKGCLTYSDCLGCGPVSRRDQIVSCVLSRTCPSLLDCMAF